MNEAGFYQRIRKKILAAFPLSRIDRIENNLSSGIPDVSACINGVDVWIELKYAEKWPARASTRLLSRYGLNPDQVNWHIRQATAGGASYVAVGVGRETLVASGADARTINDWTQEDWANNAITMDQLLERLKSVDTVK